jgi:hypothetical protein
MYPINNTPVDNPTKTYSLHILPMCLRGTLFWTTTAALRYYMAIIVAKKSTNMEPLEHNTAVSEVLNLSTKCAHSLLTSSGKTPMMVVVIY